jgi:Tol biopolymer transport system component
MTRTRRLLLPTAILALAIAAVAHVAAQPQGSTPEALMGAAQHQEEVEGNLAAAIATYRKVADNPKAPRALAAAALLQIGRLHEKLGSREATRAYERIAKDFADQPTIVAQARSRLTALAAAPKATADGQVVARQVWAGEGVDPGGSISPDGRQYAFVDWTTTATGNLAVRDLATGDVRRLTTAATLAEGYAASPAWSADGKRLAYVWGEKVVRIIGSDGTGSRDVFTRQDTYPYWLRWSPDGRTLAMELSAFGVEATNELALLSVETGQLTRSRPTGTRELSFGHFSPDGHHFVFGLGAQDGSDDGGIHVLAVDSGQDTPLVGGPGRYAHPAWSPDGGTIVFLSDRSGAMGLWAVTVADARAVGQPRLLRPNTGQLTKLDFSRDGTLWYGLRNQTTDVYVCDLDPVRLAPLSTPARLSERFVGANSGSAWSPDGNNIAYMRGTDRHKRTMVVRDMRTGTERELTAPFTDTGIASTYGPTWLPDGRGMLVPDVNFAASRFTVQQLGLDATQPRVAFDGELNKTYPHVRVSPDGSAFYFTRRDPTPSAERGTLLLVRRDRASGAETELYRAPSLGAVGFFALAVSPDGRHLSFSQNTGDNERALVVVPAAGGQHRVIYRGNYRMPQPWTGVWTPDGRHVVVTGRLSVAPGAPNDLWAVPVDGGPPKALGLSRRGGLSAASFSPDGKRLAFTGGDSSSELWSLTNVLSSPATAAR